MPESKQKVTLEKEDIYVGLDVHKSNWTVAIYTEPRWPRTALPAA
jgi:hypothetical protein